MRHTVARCRGDVPPPRFHPCLQMPKMFYVSTQLSMISPPPYRQYTTRLKLPWSTFRADGLCCDSIQVARTKHHLQPVTQAVQKGDARRQTALCLPASTLLPPACGMAAACKSIAARGDVGRAAGVEIQNFSSQPPAEAQDVLLGQQHQDAGAAIAVARPRASQQPRRSRSQRLDLHFSSDSLTPIRIDLA